MEDIWSEADSYTDVGTDDAGDEEDESNGAVEQIEDYVLQFLSQLSLAQPGIGTTQSKSKKRVCLKIAQRNKPALPDGTRTTRTMIFPQRAQTSSCKPFARTFKILDVMHQAITDDIPCTKRDIYYQDVPLFKSQSVVDQLVDDISATFGMGRADMHVRASAKGLFCGAALTIHLSSGEVISGNESESALIPTAEQIVHLDVSDDLAWVLVVEKEAVFQTLVHQGFADCSSSLGRGIIITGKGYPDLATRHLVGTFSRNLPSSIPIVAIVDADPHGIDIMSTYQFGSRAMLHEGDAFTAPNLRWGGVLGTELSRIGVDVDLSIPITKHDEKKAMSLLSRNDLPQSWRRELQHMLFKRRKAEIEIVSSANLETLQDHLRSNLLDMDICSDDLMDDMDMEPTPAWFRQPLACYVALSITRALDRRGSPL